MTRQEMLDSLHSQAGEWDIIIIGGGATGVGVAIDAASRGYDTLLVEAIDFGKGTSSRSTKLAAFATSSRATSRSSWKH
jgi:glycerol-3-phosphate dehydrogenase